MFFRWWIATFPKVVNQCPFSSRFAISVSQWACQLQWPVHEAPQEPISLLELYVDWCLFSGLTAPIKVAEHHRGRKAIPVYKFRDESVVADTTLQTMSIQSHTWTRMFRWFLPKIIDLQHYSICAVSEFEAYGLLFVAHWPFNTSITHSWNHII